MKTVVFDIDGVLADNSRRYARLDRSNPDWKQFHAGQHEDPVIEDNVALLRMLWASDHNIMLATNRFEAYRDQTMRWLREHRIPFTRLLMRQPGTRYIGAKSKVIRDLLDEGIEVVMYVDDDPGHCQDVRDACGIPVLYVHSGYMDHFTVDLCTLPDDPIGSV